MASKVSGYIGKINPGNGTQYSLGSTAYGYCETAAATAAKTVDMTGFILTEGATIFIQFKYNNTATDDPTLNVQSTGAKPLIPKTWYAGAILSLTYDGTSWIQENAYLDASVITTGTLPTARGGTGATSYRINSVIVGSATPTETGGTVASQLTWVQSKSGALYSTGTNEPTQFGTLPVAQGGTGNTSYDANRVIYSESTTKLSVSGHYASSSKLAISSTSAPTENFYVNGTTGLNGATSHKTGHIYLEGSQASSSTGNTTQIVFGTSSSQHIALSSNSGAFIINPTTSSTTGQIVLKPGATSYISSGRLTINAAGNDSYNLYVNGTMLVHRDTTTTADLPAGINFSVKDTTTDQTYSSGGIFAYHDHHASSTYGFNMVIKSGGAMIIGGGEAPSSLYTVLHNAAVEDNNGSFTTEASYFVTDGATYIYSNANSIANRIGIALSTGGHILPYKAEAANSGIQDIGSSAARWKNIHVGYMSTYPIDASGTITRYNEILCKNDSNNLVGALIYDSGSATNVTTGRWIFQEYSPNSTANASTTGKSEWYQLPIVTTGLTANKTYDILTSKNTVTIAQGGTGLTASPSMLVNLASTTAVNVLQASPRPGITGTLPIGNGGTGATTAAAARANLGALGAESGTYDGMANMAGATNTYIRTTQNGIIPYESGSAGNGHGNIGTSSWRFANAYVDHIYGVDILTNQAGAGQGLQIQSNSTRVAQLYLFTRGTTSATGAAQLILGNNIATGTAENAAGMIQIHGTNTGYHRIQPTASTSNYTHYFPNSTGWIATGGNGTSTGVGSASQPVYLSSAGVLTACTCYEVVQHTGDGTTSMSLTFSFAPDIIIVLSPRGINYFNTDGTVDNQPTNNRAPTRSYNYVLMSNVTTSYVALDKNWMSVGQQDGQGLMRQVFKEGTSLQWAYTGTFVGYPVQHKKSSNGKQYFLQINSMINAQFSNNYGPWNIWNETGLVSTFLGIKF